MSKQDKLTFRQMVVSNFDSDDKRNPAKLPWLKIADPAWLKANKQYRGLYKGICPHVILAILDDAAGFRPLAEQAISEARAASPQATRSAPPPPPSPIGATYWVHTNGVRLDEPVDRANAMQYAVSDPNALFYLVVGGDGWKTAKELSLQLPPPPAIKPDLPPPVNEAPVADSALISERNDGAADAGQDGDAVASTTGITSLAEQILAQRKSKSGNK